MRFDHRTRGERADLIFVPAARGPARQTIFNGGRPDARKIFSTTRARSPFKKNARVKCPKILKNILLFL